MSKHTSVNACSEFLMLSLRCHRTPSKQNTENNNRSSRISGRTRQFIGITRIAFYRRKENKSLGVRTRGSIVSMEKQGQMLI